MRVDSPLNPGNRTLYSEFLRPPIGYELEKALATTYSLDFETALSVPAIIAFRAAENRGQVLDEDLDLLQGIQRLAKDIVVFCHIGKIAARSFKHSRLTATLEDSIIEVEAPNGGVFHPKLWILRFKASDNSEATLLRLVVLSRNMTIDNSWDISLILDGKLGDVYQNDNTPIAELIKELPSMARGRNEHKVASKIVTSLATDVMLTKWKLPPNVNRIRFAVNGLKKSQTEVPFIPRTGKRIGIVSPFITIGALRALTKDAQREDCWLVSRDDELAKVSPEVNAQFGNVMVLHDQAETENGKNSSEFVTTGKLPRGIHAKIFVTEHSTDHGLVTELTLGSGNATTAALLNGKNVELFATLSGPTRKLGKVSEHMENDGFKGFLREWDPSRKSTLGDITQSHQSILDDFREQLVKNQLILSSKDETENDVILMLSSTSPIRIPDNIKVEFWSFANGEHPTVSVKSNLDTKGKSLGKILLANVTRWVGVRLTDKTSLSKKDTSTISFVLGAEIIGISEKRFSKMLSGIIISEEKFLRYIHLLLGSQQESRESSSRNKKFEHHSASVQTHHDFPLLEDMVRALINDKEKLHSIEKLISYLADQTDETGNPIIPESFQNLWSAFQEALPRGNHRG